MADYFRQDYLNTPDGAALYFQVHGDGEPGMILCDGLGCDGFAWKYLVPELRENFRVLRWHYRGHGRSGIATDPNRLGMLYTCDDLNRILDRVGLERGVVFGHSMGVQVALEFHRRYPSRVSGLVLLCGSYGHPLDTFHDDTMLRTAFPFARKVIESFPRLSSTISRVALRTELAVQLALSFELNRDLVQKADLVPYFEHLARMDPVMFVRTLNDLAEHSAWDHLAHVNVPTLVIAGERDTFTPPWLSRRMADAIPGAELMIVPQGSHTTPLEQPQLVGRRIDRFLRTRVLANATSGSSPGPGPSLPAPTEKRATNTVRKRASKPRKQAKPPRLESGQ